MDEAGHPHSSPLGAISEWSPFTSTAGRLLYSKKPFEFLSLGLLAYVGNDQALTQFEAGDASVALYGQFAYLLWRSVYITKQVGLFCLTFSGDGVFLVGF